MSEKEEVSKIFSKRLKELRMDRGIKQAELAREIVVSPSAIGMWEQGRREPDYDHLRRIARYFNVSIDFLLDDDTQFVHTADERALVAAYRELDDRGKQYIRESVEMSRLRLSATFRQPAYQTAV